MHLTGISKDKDGNKYYVIKNSWGEVGPYKGYLHMSEAYLRLKTVAIFGSQRRRACQASNEVNLSNLVFFNKCKQ